MTMRRHLAALAAAVLIWATPVRSLAADGLITLTSAHGADATIDRFEAAVKKRGFMVFGRLDHAAAAASVDLKMPRATVIVFGNPRLGTPMFIQRPTLAIDLPLKAMVWEDAGGKVFLSYNSAEYVYGTIYPRHAAPVDKAVVARVEEALKAIADETRQ